MANKKIIKISKMLFETEEKRQEFNEKYQRAKNERMRERVRIKIRPLDLLLEFYFYKLWKLYKKRPDELELIYEYKSQVDNKIKLVYCEGELHFVTSRKGKLKYGVFCDC